MTEVAECHGCLLRGEGAGDIKKGLVSWRRLCTDCELHATSPLLIPHERVRLCTDSIGEWTQHHDLFHLWKPGAPAVDGVTVCVRKFALSTPPDDNVAVVFQRASDAKIVDDILESRMAKMIRPLTLRYSSTLRTFCADIAFPADDASSCAPHERGDDRAREKRARPREEVMLLGGEAPGEEDAGPAETMPNGAKMAKTELPAAAETIQAVRTSPAGCSESHDTASVPASPNKTHDGEPGGELEGEPCKPSNEPGSEPSGEPTGVPGGEPTGEPTGQPAIGDGSAGAPAVAPNGAPLLDEATLQAQHAERMQQLLVAQQHTMVQQQAQMMQANGYYYPPGFGYAAMAMPMQGYYPADWYSQQAAMMQHQAYTMHQQVQMQPPYSQPAVAATQGATSGPPPPAGEQTAAMQSQAPVQQPMHDPAVMMQQHQQQAYVFQQQAQMQQQAQLQQQQQQLAQMQQQAPGMQSGSSQPSASAGPTMQPPQMMRPSMVAQPPMFQPQLPPTMYPPGTPQNPFPIGNGAAAAAAAAAGGGRQPSRHTQSGAGFKWRSRIIL